METGCSDLYGVMYYLLYDTIPIHCTPLPLHPPSAEYPEYCNPESIARRTGVMDARPGAWARGRRQKAGSGVSKARFICLEKTTKHRSTVGFHNFNLRIFNLRVSNPNKFIVDVFLTRCRIAMCQGLGPTKHADILEIDRMF